MNTKTTLLRTSHRNPYVRTFFCVREYGHWKLELTLFLCRLARTLRQSGEYLCWLEYLFTRPIDWLTLLTRPVSPLADSCVLSHFVDWLALPICPSISLQSKGNCQYRCIPCNQRGNTCLQFSQCSVIVHFFIYPFQISKIFTDSVLHIYSMIRQDIAFMPCTNFIFTNNNNNLSIFQFTRLNFKVKGIHFLQRNQ